MKLNRQQLRKIILQELFLINDYPGPSKFNVSDTKFASALRDAAARDYPESEITVDLSEYGVGLTSAAGVFAPVTLKVATIDHDHRSGEGTIFISGPGGLSGRFDDGYASGFRNNLFEVAADEILARLHGR